MAASTLRELLIRLGVDSTTAEANLDKFESSIGKAKDAMEDLVGFAVKVTAALAAVGAAAIYQAVQTGQSAEQIREQAAAIGVTTDAYQELSFVASRYGIDSEKITMILSKLAVDQKAVADGNEEAAATYAQLGLSIDQVTAASPDELLALMADGFGNVTDASDRLAIASTLFGDRIASSLIPLLAGGSAGLEEMARQAHDLGVIMSEDSIIAADEFNDRVENLGLLLTGVRNEIGLALIPAFTRLADRFLSWYETNQEAIKQAIDKYAEKVADAFIAVADALTRANDILGGADGWFKLGEALAALTGSVGFGYVALQVGTVVAGLFEAGVAMATFVGGGTALLSIIGAIVAGVAQMVAGLAAVGIGLLVFQDVLTYIQGGDSVIGRLIERMKEAGGVLGALGSYWEAMGNVARAVLGLIGDGLAWANAQAEMILGAIDRVAAAFGSWLGNVGIQFQPFIDLLSFATTQLNNLAGFLGGGTAPGADAGAAAVQARSAGATSAGATAATSAVPSAASYAPYSSGGGAAGGTSKSVSIGGDTITLTGLAKEEMIEIIDRKMEERERMTRDALAGGEL